jgi:aminoglycoside phosphotransferase (APT) family kinase protein
VAAARPGIALRALAVSDDEVVLAGGEEVFRLPLSADAVARHAVLVRALPQLRTRLPVPVPVPRYVGVLPDGSTPFTAEPRLPGEPADELGSIATGQLAGALEALAAVPEREAQQWGVPGSGALLHGDLGRSALLVDPQRRVLTGLVGWRLRLGEPADDLDALPEAVRRALG